MKPIKLPTFVKELIAPVSKKKKWFSNMFITSEDETEEAEEEAVEEAPKKSAKKKTK